MTKREFNKKLGRWIPKGSRAVLPPAGLACVAFIYHAERNGVLKTLALGYGGKRTKADWHYSFKDDAEARGYVAKWFAGRAESAKVKAGWRAKRQAEKCLTVADVWAKAQKQGSISAAETAICLRAELARQFPGVKFSVTSENFSMGCAVRVHWTDGPTGKAVEAVADGYSFAGFDGIIDLKYSVDRWLAPDGSMSLAQSEGTTGSMGSHGEVLGDPHHAGAVLVRNGAHYVTCSRDRTLAGLLPEARAVARKYAVPMPETFADVNALHRWLNTTRKEWGNGLGEQMATLLYREERQAA